MFVPPPPPRAPQSMSPFFHSGGVWKLYHTYRVDSVTAVVDMCAGRPSRANHSWHLKQRRNGGLPFFVGRGGCCNVVRRGREAGGGGIRAKLVTASEHKCVEKCSVGVGCYTCFQHTN
ncbi:unnamed protein product [Ectocarpus sp. 8 AP-2014]